MAVEGLQMFGAPMGLAYWPNCSRLLVVDARTVCCLAPHLDPSVDNGGSNPQVQVKDRTSMHSEQTKITK